MKIVKQPCGDYQTNCYILIFEEFEVIIDPGVNALPFVRKNCKNPIVILNTHGHFDHIWSNKEVSEFYNIEVYTPKDDEFMLTLEQMPDQPKYENANLVNPDETVTFNDINFTFHHLPGHTPGCSMIEVKENYFSGDFVFKDSIGRWDFPYSNANDMKKSISKFGQFTTNFPIHPGHGESTYTKIEQKNIIKWLDFI